MTADSKVLWNSLTLKFDNKQEETGESWLPLVICVAAKSWIRDDSRATVSLIIVSTIRLLVVSFGTHLLTDYHFFWLGSFRKALLLFFTRVGAGVLLSIPSILFRARPT